MREPVRKAGLTVIKLLFFKKTSRALEFLLLSEGGQHGPQRITAAREYPEPESRGGASWQNTDMREPFGGS